MLEQWIRAPYQRYLVDPLAERICLMGPNAISLLAGALGPLVAMALVFAHPILASALLLLSGYLDSLDGTLARMHHLSSEKGTVLDIVMDRLVEFSVVFGLLLQAPADRAIVSSLMLGSILLCVTSFLVVGLFSENDSDKSFHYSPGLIERPEAFALFIAMILRPAEFHFFAWTFIILTSLTTVIRVHEFFKQSSQ